jgi:hypothetical protein
MTDAISPVGKDCDCGHPLIWIAGRQVCAVYGRHPSDDEIVSFTGVDERLIHYRDRGAPGAALIAAVMAAPNNAPNAVRHRRNREAARARAKAVTAA